MPLGVDNPGGAPDVGPGGGVTMEIADGDNALLSGNRGAGEETARCRDHQRGNADNVFQTDRN
jgi:hypothetical protein